MKGRDLDIATQLPEKGSAAAQADLPMLWGHPAGLFLVAGTEFWERFSFYSVSALLALFLVAPAASGGAGWEVTAALQLVGVYGGAAFVAPVLGGLIAGRWISERRAIALGGLVIMLGHVGLGIQAAMSQAMRGPALTLSLAALVAGTGLLKPAISSMIGEIYPEGGARREFGYTIFTMCIWTGAMAAGFVSGTLGEKVEWHYGFLAAAIGMAIGLGAYLALGGRLLGNTGIRVAAPARVDTPDRSADTAGLIVIAIFSAFTVLYSAFFFLNGGLLNLLVQRNTNRLLWGFEIPATWFLSISTGVFILAAPLAARLWRRLDRMGRNPDVLLKQIAAMALMGGAYLLLWSAADLRAGGSQIRTSMLWFIGAYTLFGVADTLVWPVQMSAIAALSPPGRTSAVFGAWLFATGVGIWLTGPLGALATAYGEAALFAAIAGTCAVSMALLAIIRVRAARVLRDAPPGR